jgi:hypothetical protein
METEFQYCLWNEECKDESVYIIMQAWGLCRGWKIEIKFQRAELTVNAVKYVSSFQHATNIQEVVFE